MFVKHFLKMQVYSHQSDNNQQIEEDAVTGIKSDKYGKYAR